MSNDNVPFPIDEKKKALIRQTLLKDATREEADLFLHVCEQVGLDPILKQIYPIRRGGQLTTQVGIDGYRIIAERNGQYAPGREPKYEYRGDGKLPFSATAYVKKRTPDGVWHEVSATAFYEEYKPAAGSKFWGAMPHVMLAKCAEANALRKAFPGHFAGIYCEEEMAQANNPTEATVESKKRTVAPVEPKAELPFEGGTPLETLEQWVSNRSSLPTEHLGAWMEARAKQQKVTLDEICQTAMNPRVFNSFLQQYAEEVDRIQSNAA